MFKKALKVLATVVAVGLAAVAVYALYKIITAELLKNEIRKKHADAFKVLIKKKKKNAVNVGIFGPDDQHIADEEYKSDKGVADDIYEGQVIYC